MDLLSTIKIFYETFTIPEDRDDSSFEEFIYSFLNENFMLESMREVFANNEFCGYFYYDYKYDKETDTLIFPIVVPSPLES